LPLPSSFKKRIACSMMPIARLGVKLAPGMRAAIWSKIIEGRLDWRSLEYVKPAHFGAVFAGNTADIIQRYIYFFGCWEPQVEAVISHSLRPGDTFVDVGANIGYFSLLAADRTGPTGHVYAFEASQKTFDKLRANIQRNGMDSVIDAVHAAVADRDGTLTLYAGPDDNCGMSSLIRNEGGTEENVEARPLGKLLPEEVLRSARLIKIDVEGAEELVVAGLEPDFDKVSADVLMELNPKLASMGRVLEILAVHGRRSFEILPADSIKNYFSAPLPAVLKPLSGTPSHRCDVLFSTRSDAELIALGIQLVGAPG
jgi:FkbM family methyltransferase